MDAVMQKALSEKEFAERMNMSVRLFRKLARESGIPAPMNPMTNYRNWVWNESAVSQFVGGTYKGSLGTPPAAAAPTAQAPAAKKKRGRPAAAAATSADASTSEFILPSDFVIEPLPDGSIKISVRKKG